MEVISIVCDAISAAYLGPYGAEWVDTPQFNRLACEGIVFDHCYCPYTGGAPSGWDEALEQLEHDGTCAGVSVIRIQESNDSGEHSLRAALSSASQSLIDVQGKTSDFLLWIDLKLCDSGWQPSTERLKKILEDRPPVDPGGRLVGWLDKEVTEDQIDALRDTYSARIEELDACLGEFFDRLREADLYHNANIVFTAREGWPLGEHGMIGPAAPWSHEERDHVPLLIKYPGAPAAARRPHLVTSLDVIATIRAALGLDTAQSPRNNGQDLNQPRHLLDIAVGKAAGWRDAVVTGFDGHEIALRTNDWKLILPFGADGSRKRMLFRKPSDRWEFNDLADVQMDIADQLEGRLRSSFSLRTA